MNKFILEVILDLNKNSIRNRNNISIMSIIVIRTDNASEYISLKNKFRKHRITLEIIFIYIYYQIGIAKRFNRTIDNIIRTMLSQLELFISF